MAYQIKKSKTKFLSMSDSLQSILFCHTMILLSWFLRLETLKTSSLFFGSSSALHIFPQSVLRSRKFCFCILSLNPSFPFHSYKHCSNSNPPNLSCRPLHNLLTGPYLFVVSCLSNQPFILLLS